MSEKKPFRPGEYEPKQPEYKPEIKHSDQDFDIEHGNYEKRDDDHNRISRPIRNPKGDND